MLKSLMTIETLALSMDEDFVLMDTLRRHSRRMTAEQLDPRNVARSAERMLRDVADLAGRLPRDLRAILDRVRRGQFQLRVQHEHLESLVRTLDKSSDRVELRADHRRPAGGQQHPRDAAGEGGRNHPHAGNGPDGLPGGRGAGHLAAGLDHPRPARLTAGTGHLGPGKRRALGTEA